RPMAEQGSREQAVLRARRESLERLRARGIEPFAFNLELAIGVAEPTPSAVIRQRHGATPPARTEEARYGVAGRVLFRRSFGDLVFLVLRDREGDLQVVCDRAHLSDLGDLVGAYGRVGTTKRGELSIFAERLAMLSKALRPLPEKWHGLKDPDL